MSTDSSYPATFHGIQKWYVHMFEKLGWIVLTNEHGNKQKVDCYLNSVERLQKAISEKIRTVKCEDKKTDLTIMKNNVDILIRHARNDFKSAATGTSQTGGAKTGSRRGSRSRQGSNKSSKGTKPSTRKGSKKW